MDYTRFAKLYLKEKLHLLEICEVQKQNYERISSQQLQKLEKSFIYTP